MGPCQAGAQHPHTHTCASCLCAVRRCSAYTHGPENLIVVPSHRVTAINSDTCISNMSPVQQACDIRKMHPHATLDVLFNRPTELIATCPKAELSESNRCAFAFRMKT